MTNKKNTLTKIYKVLKAITTIFLIFVLLVVIVQKFSDNNIKIGGISIYTIISESMKPEYKIGDIVISKETKPSDIKIGDDVTYEGQKGDLKGLTITHRVIDKKLEKGKYHFATKGIANEFEDPSITEDNIYGKVIYKTVLFSFIGRLMTNVAAYYIIFTVVGVSASYQVIKNHFMKKEEDEEYEKETEQVGNN